MDAMSQARFAAALLDPDMGVPEEVATPENGRFAVYRNNVVAGLATALATRFPAVETIVGSEFFAAMAGVFVRRHPPRSPVMHEYGDAFPGFIETFPPAAGLTFLPDVARLEWARGVAYHAADTAPIDPGVLTRLAPDALPGLRIALHPSLAAIASDHPIRTIWAMNSGDGEATPIERWEPEEVLVVRPHEDVLVRLLPPGGAAFVAMLATDRPLGEAAAGAARPGFDLAGALALLIGTGSIVAVRTDPSSEERS
ncbi:MAG: putative DNA-binding domain-containing protein [Alphaproteobacteria bacterium]|nr:putative DNA-binding domain-containing protein [Alphaproteobacteria bacterium]